MFIHKISCKAVRPASRAFHHHNYASTLRSYNSPLSILRHHHLKPHHVVRNISFFSLGKFAAKMVRVPAYVGSGMVAAGSYVAYKVEQASSAAQDRLDQVKDFAGDVFDGVNRFFSGFGGASGSSEGAGGGGGQNEGGSGTVAALGTAIGLTGDEKTDETVENDDEEELLEEEDDEEDQEDSTNDEMLNLTRQMIEIRNILERVDTSNNVKLPSIVVVGSQSSGKSSVLESVVGREFLPKGSNMVTRRPIELTLVNSPELASEVAEFPALNLSGMTDFASVQKLLHDLNMQVPSHECVSSNPIQLTIRSPRVPDLSLVDLPGYIQVEAADQPVELKRKIKQLCDKYLQEPNIILLISAADVDLANSLLLRAARTADPRGERTIGVITKLDLVDLDKGRAILTNRKYPLKMGYVGVVTKTPQQSLFSKKTGFQLYIAQQNYERQYFADHKEQFAGTGVSTRVLRRKLMKVLEKSMGASLRPTYHLVQQELEETSYKFKVEFNDRKLTPETYLAGSIDTIKVAVKELSELFGRHELRSLLKYDLDQKVLDLLLERYWNKVGDDDGVLGNTGDLRLLLQSNSNDLYWVRKLDLATSSLTKSGIGRLSTSLVTRALLSEVDNIIDNSPLRNHPMAKATVKESALSVLNGRFFSTADQVENCIKPYKYEIELEDREWAVARENSIELLKEELKQCDFAFTELKKQIGGRKLSQLMSYLEEKNQEENLNFSAPLIQRGKEAIFLKNRSQLIKFRLQLLKSGLCKSKDNKYKCPEIFLTSLLEKLTQTAVLFLNVELLSDFYYNFPRELDMKIGNLTSEEIERLAKEDPKVKKHVEMQQRKELLELAMSKIEDVLLLQKHKMPLETKGW